MELEVVNYIKEARHHGLADTQIKQNLLDAGWEAGTVDESFSYVKASEFKATPAATSGEVEKTPLSEVKPVAIPIKQVTTPKIESQVSTVELTDSTVGTNRKFPFKLLIGVIALLLVLGGSAFGYYSLVLNNPTKIWSKFLQTPQSKIYQSKIQFSYVDPESLTATSTIFNLKDLKFNVNGDLYANISDPKNPQSDTNLQYTYSSGNTSFSTGFQYTLLNNVLYVNVGNNPLLSTIFNQENGGKKTDWLKIDLTQLNNTISNNQVDTTSASQAKMLKDVFNTDFATQLQKIWENANVIKVKKYVGRETVNGVSTLHFENEVDKQALKNAFDQILTKVVTAFRNDGSVIADSDIDNVKFAVDSIVDKMNVSDMQTWVGTKDFALYKVHFVSNAPSVISAINTFSDSNFGISLPQSRDAKRLADIRQLAAALELYYNDYNGYPEANTNGQPAGGISPSYIGLIPTSPIPADGNCTDYYNSYWYTPSGTKTVSNGKTVYSSYTYTFCLGSSISGYKPGIAQLTPQGIAGNVPCTGNSASCSKTGTTDQVQTVHDQIQSTIDKIKFSATVTIDANYHDYGKTKQLSAPADSYDVLGVLNNAQAKSRDARRLADVRQMASAMELYFNDKNQYPKAVSDLVPKYLGTLLTAPTPADGSCSDSDNSYTYQQQTNGQNYSLNFCLGADTAGYNAGKHMLSPAGIQ